MQERVSDAWRLEGPLVERHIGDLAWSRYHIAGREKPGTLDFQVHPRRRELLDVVLDWFDGVGELEPLGTDPRFARRGLGAAVCVFALGRLRERGAGGAVVCARGDAAYPAPLRLYESVGFLAVTRSLTFRRTRR
jgi:ribosomal protein S18 acetylase RimI-like enzyme